MLTLCVIYFLGIFIAVTAFKVFQPNENLSEDGNMVAIIMCWPATIIVCVVGLVAIGIVYAIDKLSTLIACLIRKAIDRLTQDQNNEL